jgi:carbamoyltransferase
MKTILGISSFYHDSAAAIVRGGEIIAAAQEERFSRKKHDPRFPRHAINYCLEEAFLEASDLDAIVFYDNPLWTWDRVLKTCLTAGVNGREQFEKAAPSVLGHKIWVEKLVQESLGTLGKEGHLLFAEHHMTHAASAFYPSPFESAAVMTFDGVGEWATATFGMGNGASLSLQKEIRFPHSLGLLYSAFTYFCGFKVNSGEYKLMGLAPYGRPIYADLIRKNLIDVKEDGSFRLNLVYFGYVDGMTMTSPAFDGLFGGPQRKPESRITRREMDLAASVQVVLEEVVLKAARNLRKETGSKNLAMAGGCALNCVANGKLLREKIFDHIWIQPAAGDAGGALGAAQLVSHVYFKESRTVKPSQQDSMKGSYLGPSYSSAEIKAFLNRNSYPAQQINSPDDRAQTIAQALSDGKIVGFFQGRMEFGPRSLGGRSILGDPRKAETQSVMNLKVKYRESFRPFAPAVLADEVSTYFELDKESPYMLLVAPVKKERQLPMDWSVFSEGQDDMLPLLHQPRSDIPAITHVDYSARVQTVHPETNPEFYRVLSHFKRLTNCGVLVNTSFNVRGEPIVCSPKEAYQCFMRTEMDLLVLEDQLLWKSEQPVREKEESWKEVFELD